MEIDDDDEDILPVPIDRASRRRLAELVRVTGAPAARLAASIIHDVLAADEAEHQQQSTH